jgi:hypothetical protein
LGAAYEGDGGQMKFILPLMLLATTSAPADHPTTYLLSIIDVPLNNGESIESFSISTWGVEFRAVCKIPGGWRIRAGSSATPDGVLEGEGSQGATWFNRSSPSELRDLVLVTLYDEVQRSDVRNGEDATFKGFATVSTPNGEKKTRLSYRNVRLTPARDCP